MNGILRQLVTDRAAHRAARAIRLGSGISAMILALALTGCGSDGSQSSRGTAASEQTSASTTASPVAEAQASAAAGPALAVAETAKRTWDFTNAIGVRMDLDDDNGDNNYIDQFAAIGPALADLKIKYVRLIAQDLANDDDKYGRVMSLYNNYGTKFLFVFGNPTLPVSTMQLSAERAAESGAALGFEGPNEWSKYQYYTGTNYRPNWADEVADYQRELQTYLRGGPWPTGPIVAPSIWFRDNWAGGQLKDRGVSSRASVANLHYYHDNEVKPTTAARRQPDSSTSNPNDWLQFATDMDTVVRDLGIYYKSGPYWVTETGEQTAEGGEGGNPVSLIQAAKYIPRLMMEFFKRDAQKVFLFELMDQAPGQYGLMRADKSKRPSYTAVKNLMNILTDTGGTAANFTPQTLNFTITGTGISYVLMQKSDNTFFLVLWKDVYSTDTNDQAQNTTLSWTGFTSPTVKTYRPRTAAGVTQTWTNVSSVPLSVRDDLLIVEIKR